MLEACTILVFPVNEKIHSLLAYATVGWVLITYNLKHLDYFNKYYGDSFNR